MTSYPYFPWVPQKNHHAIFSHNLKPKKFYHFAKTALWLNHFCRRIHRILAFSNNFFFALYFLSPLVCFLLQYFTTFFVDDWNVLQLVDKNGQFCRIFLVSSNLLKVLSSSAFKHNMTTAFYCLELHLTRMVFPI